MLLNLPAVFNVCRSRRRRCVIPQATRAAAALLALLPFSIHSPCKEKLPEDLNTY